MNLCDSLGLCQNDKGLFCNKKVTISVTLSLFFNSVCLVRFTEKLKASVVHQHLMVNYW